MNATATTATAQPIAVLTCKERRKWTPTLKYGDKWEILKVHTGSLPGFLSYHARRVRDGMLASFSADSLRLSFHAARFLKSPLCKP